MGVMQASQTIQAWPEESKEAAQLVIKQYGEPDEVTETQPTWHKPGPWKRIVASKTFYLHNFPHTDSVESFIDYRVPCKNSRGLPSSMAASLRSEPQGKFPLAAMTSTPTSRRSISCTIS